MEENNHHIPGIYNWCDRWCERCKYTDRCYSYQMELEAGLTEEDKDPSNPKMWEYVANNLQKAMDMIREDAEKFGIDLDNLPELEELPKSDEFLELEAKLNNLHEAYLDRVDAFFENSKEFFPEKGEESVRWVEMGMAGEAETLQHWETVTSYVETISWYKFFIWAKLDRALNGMEDMYEECWGEPEQSDAYRCARIVIIAFERSMAAWQAMHDLFPEKRDEILDMLALLAKMRRETEALFPNWRMALPEVDW